jgi:hypothetical protein
MRVSSRTLKVFVALGVALHLGGCAGAGHRPQLSSDSPARFERGNCWFESLSGVARVDCGYLVVPENRDRKTSPEIRIAVGVLRRDATASDDAAASAEWVNGARLNLPTSAHLIRAGGGHGTLHDVCGFDLVAAYENDPSHAPELECDTKHSQLPFAVDAATAIRAVGL